MESCVNYVGVKLNSASPALLRHVSGLTAPVAERIAAYRSEIGGFTSRSQLKEIKGLGAKTFEQCWISADCQGTDPWTTLRSIPVISFSPQILKLIGYETKDLNTSLPEIRAKLKDLDPKQLPLHSTLANPPSGISWTLWLSQAGIPGMNCRPHSLEGMCWKFPICARE